MGKCKNCLHAKKFNNIYLCFNKDKIHGEIIPFMQFIHNVDCDDYEPRQKHEELKGGNQC